MKNILKLTAILLILTSSFTCEKETTAKSEPNNNLFGTWQLIETNFGIPNGWNKIENGYTYTFLENGRFTSTRFSECTYGTFTLTETSLTLHFGCAGFSTGIEQPAGIFVENIFWDNGYLLLHPNYMSCDEGCAYKFQKLIIN
jgi:hypothetical protein